MHSHFGSATHLGATFLGVLIAGTFWHIAWLRVGAAGAARNNQTMQKAAQAALFQY